MYWVVSKRWAMGEAAALAPSAMVPGLHRAMLSTLESGVEHRDVGYRGTLVGGPRDREVVLLGSTSLIQGPSRGSMAFASPT